MKKYFLILLVALVTTPIASADQDQARNATPKVYGKTIGNWSHAWWVWAYSLPSSTSPPAQNGSVDCSAGQSGKVWYLAGTFGAPAADRTCSIKKGKAILFPLLNGIFWAPEDCSDENSCRTLAGGALDAVTIETCTIDDTPCVWSVQIVRAQSEARSLKIPAGSFPTTAGGGSYAPGKRKISIADGYWVMLDPLPPGIHEIHFKASVGTFSLDVNYKPDGRGLKAAG